MILVRFPIWVCHIPWRWIIGIKLVLALTLTMWLCANKILDGLQRNADGFKELAEFEVYPK